LRQANVLRFSLRFDDALVALDEARVERWDAEAVSRWRHLARSDPDNLSARRSYLLALALAGWSYVEPTCWRHCNGWRPHWRSRSPRFEATSSARPG
jgi:hypothetical protein